AGIDIPSAVKFVDGDDGFCHRSVAAGGADIAEGFLQDAACGSHVSDISNGDDVIRFEDAAHECPLDSFKRQAEIRHLRNQIVALDAAEIDECDRSEEHTSELQSPCNLVCRLLLEKKKIQSRCEHDLTRQDAH